MKRNNFIFTMIISILVFAFLCSIILYLFIPTLVILQILKITILLTIAGLVIFLANLFLYKSGFVSFSKELDDIYTQDNINLTKQITGSGNKFAQSLTDKINNITDRLNSIFLDVSRSTRKFNLFASDIFFSARHMSEQSHTQSETMDSILNQVYDFQNALSHLDSEISEILTQLNSTSDAYRGLGDLSEASSIRLAPLVNNTQDATKEVNKGLLTINNSSVVINNLVEIMGNLQQSMGEMNKNTSQVSQVMEKLDDIAERTHILATNASIEAARAGKQGASFSVIASEVRNLAANSRDAIQEVGSFLKKMSTGINKNTQYWETGVEKVYDVQRFGNNAREILESINSRMEGISVAMNDFEKQFKSQGNIIDDTLKNSASVTKRINGFTKTLKDQSRGYILIQEQVKKASSGSESVSKSASVLSQLATYLKVGGKELQYAVKPFIISEKRHLSGLIRQELRRGLLYNLEVFHRDSFIGNLGDLSQSGLLLYSDKDFELNKEFPAKIILPIGFSGLESVSIFFTPRRSEPDDKTYRIGCTLRLKDIDQTEDFIEILEKLTIYENNDSQEALALSLSHDDLDTNDDDLEELITEEE